MEHQESTATAVESQEGDKSLIHAGMLGPAFSPVSRELAASLVSQGVSVCGDVLTAIERKVELDLISAWPRMLRILRVQPFRSQTVPTYGTSDRWMVLRILTQAAMANNGALDTSRHWLNADSYARYFMGQIARAKLNEAGALKNLTGEDVLEDGPVDDAYLAKLGDDADALLAFSEGRA